MSDELRGRPARREVMGPKRWEDRGSATAEFAIVLPVVVGCVALILSVARASTVALSCQDAAATAARALIVASSEGEGQRSQVAEHAAQQVAGDGIDISVEEHSGVSRVTIRCPIIPDPLGILPSLARGEAVAVTS